jgi:hypothetical protein
MNTGTPITEIKKQVTSPGFAGRMAKRGLFVVLVAGLLAGCGKSGEELERQRLAEEEIRHSETAGPEISSEIMDSLRTMALRYKVTREEYWEGTGGVLANEFVEVWYPPGKNTVTHGMYALGQLMEARSKTLRYFGSAPDRPLKTICATSMESFNQKTGREWWSYYNIEEDEIYYQPIKVLFQRNLLDIAVARGYYEWSVGVLSGNKAPLWLRQGLSSLLSDEDVILEEQLKEFPGDNIKMSLDEIEGALGRIDNKKYYRFALYNAFRMVRKLAAGTGRDKMLEAVGLMGEGADFSDAFETVYGLSYEEVTAGALNFKVDR